MQRNVECVSYLLLFIYLMSLSHFAEWDINGRDIMGFLLQSMKTTLVISVLILLSPILSLIIRQPLLHDDQQDNFA